MKKVGFLLLIAGTALFFGCRIPLHKIDARYYGHWQGRYTNGGTYKFNFTIESSGYGVWNRVDAYGSVEGREEFDGKVTVDGQHLEIGTSLSNPRFILEEVPVLTDDNLMWLMHDSLYINANWRMKLRYPGTIGYDNNEVQFYKLKD